MICAFHALFFWSFMERRNARQQKIIQTRIHHLIMDYKMEIMKRFPKKENLAYVVNLTVRASQNHQEDD